MTVDQASTMRRVATLALPALVVLAAEPLYVLVDTAVVGHLGRTQLAGLAIGGSVMSFAVWLGTGLAYGTTRRAARRPGGAGGPPLRRRPARRRRRGGGPGLLAGVGRRPDHPRRSRGRRHPAH